MEGCDLIDQQPRVVDGATVQVIALSAATQIFEEQDDALLRLVSCRVVALRRERDWSLAVEAMLTYTVLVVLAQQRWIALLARPPA